MCGIAGILGLDGVPPKGDVRRMTRRLAHRGPDDEGFHESGPVRLGIRRLAVIDLVTGHQPMGNEDGTIQVVFNGEIFNYLELRRELEGRHRFVTQSDTEVIVHASEEWGESCVERFNGMFAIALWDGRRLILWRDRLGEKPLYWTEQGGRFLFASEVKALLEEVPAVPELDEDFRVFDAPVGDATLFRGIRALEPGHVLVHDGGRAQVRRWWTLPREPEAGVREEEWVERFRALLEDSVRLRLRSDVPVGVFLSGGLDSSLITALARPEVAYTCHHPLGPAYDELEHARGMAERAGAELVVVRPTAEDFRRLFPSIVWALDGPIATMSSIAEFLLARAARGRVKVVLGGQGADEVFGGYVRYLVMLEEDRIGNAPELREYRGLFRRLWGAGAFGDPAERYFELTRRAAPGSGAPLARLRRHFPPERPVIDRMGIADLHLSFPSLITMNDRAAAAVGLENRCPFLDHRIVELGFSIPPHLKVSGLTTKVLLRRAARGLVPDSIIDRRDKKGLVVPIGRWLAGELREWAEDLRESLGRRGLPGLPAPAAPERGEFDRSLYAAVALELWFRIFIDRTLTPETT
jgi:asparagine synthase (glutamine-hydrolysing)